MAIADFYAVHERGTIRVLVKNNGYECYILGEDHIGKGFAYDREEIEYAAIATSIFDIEWIEDEG
ncbi:MAG: hypothetical protein Q9M13_07965 [Mariprofundales bacterium]|nr:hypothetical protein [Mariprofundales bacterium]